MMLKHSLPAQYVLRKEGGELPELWKTYNSIENWNLAAEKSLPVILVSYDNRNIGWVLGFIVDKNGRLLNEGDTIELDEISTHSIEHYLEQMNGRYVAIIISQEVKRIYPDPLATQPVVYSSKYEAISSSAAPILGDNYDEDYDNEKAAMLNMPASGFFYPAGLTAHKSIQRLLPNHYLDLNTFEVSRFYYPPDPISDDDFTKEEKKRRLKRIREEIASTIKAFSPLNKVLLTLTAGRDSRMLLAACAPFMQEVGFFQFNKSFETVDEYAAKQFEKLFGINIKYLPTRKASEDEIERWLYRVGHVVSGGIMKIHTTLNDIQGYRWLMPGMGGEIGRSFYSEQWSGLSDNIVLTPRQIAKLMGLPLHKFLLDAIQKWLDPIRSLHSTAILELAYWELRDGCWGSPQLLGQEHIINHIYPFSNRKALNDMLTLPREYRISQQFAHDFCASADERLMVLPFNHLPWYKKWKILIHKISLVPDKIQDFLGR